MKTMDNIDYILNTCTYGPESSPNNPLSKVLDSIVSVAIIPAFLATAPIGIPFALIERLLVELPLILIKKLTGVSIPDALHDVLYPTINSAIAFVVTNHMLKFATTNQIAVNGISTLYAGSVFAGHYVVKPPKKVNESNEFLDALFDANEILSVATSILGTTIVVTCPITLTAKAIDHVVEKMEAKGMIDFSDSRSPFPNTPEAKLSVGGQSSSLYDRYPLHNAGALNQVERAKVLLSHLDIVKQKKALTESDTKDGGTDTALTLASYHGQLKFIELMAEEYQKLGIDINTKDVDGKSALMVTAAKGHKDAFAFIAKKYLEASLSMNEKDNAGNTAFHYLASTLLYSNPSNEQIGAYQQIFKLLTENGLDVNALNGRGKTALDILKSRDASSVNVFKMAENIDKAHCVSKLLAEDSNLETLMDRMIKIMSGLENKINMANQEELFLKIISEGDRINLDYSRLSEDNVELKSCTTTESPDSNTLNSEGDYIS